MKGVNFVGLRDAGDPVELAARYDAEGADELVFLDITARPTAATPWSTSWPATAEQVFIPFTVGGGIRSRRRRPPLLRAGADKVSVNTPAVERPSSIARVARRVRRAVRRRGHRRPAGRRRPAGWEVYTHGGRTPTGLDAVAWAEEAGGWARARSCSPRWTATAPGRLRPRAAPACADAVRRPRHRQRRRGHPGAPRRGRASTAAPTPCWPPRSSTSASTPSPRPRRNWPRAASSVRSAS